MKPASAALFHIASILSMSVLAGCAYRLPPAVPPSRQEIKLIASTPEQYMIRIETDTPRDVQVPPDGRISLQIPAYRRACGVYLFNKLQVGGFDDPLKDWTFAVIRSGKTIRKLPMRSVLALPTDNEGYRLVRIGK